LAHIKDQAVILPIRKHGNVQAWAVRQNMHIHVIT